MYSYWATYQLPVVIVRPFNNFGPSQHLEKVIPRFITSCILKEPLTIHGDGTAARDWLFVTDHCEALDRILHIEREKVVGEVFNLGTGHHRDLLEIAQAVRETMKPTHSPIQYVGDRPGQVFRHTCDASKAQRILNWKPVTSFENGLERTIKWYPRFRGLVEASNVDASNPDNLCRGEAGAPLMDKIPFF